MQSVLPERDEQGTASGRQELLERLGAYYGEQHFALVFTETNRARHPDDERPKRVTTRAWQTTQPLPHAARGVGVLTSRGQSANPAITLRTSSLVGLECDGPADLARVEEFALPATLTEQTSTPAKRHYYFRPPPELEALPKVGFRFEAGTLKADTNRYFVCSPSLHPSGAVYHFLPGLGPDEIEVAVLPEEIYGTLLREADASGPTTKTASSGTISEGDRHEHLRQISWAMRRYSGASLEAITAALLTENRTRCLPPKREQLVVALSQYTFEHVSPIGDGDE